MARFSPEPGGPFEKGTDRQTRQESCQDRDSVGASELASRRHESGSPIRPRSGGGSTTSRAEGRSRFFLDFRGSGTFVVTVTDRRRRQKPPTPLRAAG